MSGSLNVVTLLGHVGKDPDNRSTASGDRVSSFSLATTETWKNREGVKQERTSWHNIVVWGPLVETVVERYVKKGSKLYVAGSLHTRKWQDREGQDKYTTEVVLRGFDAKLILLDKPDRSDADGYSEPQRSLADELSDDVPF